MKKGFQPILDYVEGRMSITEFQFLFETDKSLQRMLKLSLDKTRICYKPYNYNLFEVFKEDYEFKNKSWDTISKRSGVQRLLVGYEHSNGHNKNQIWIETVYIRCKSNAEFAQTNSAFPLVSKLILFKIF